MAQATTYDCITDDQTPYFEAETEGFCNNHCDLSSTRQNGTRLRVEIENLLTSSYYAYVTLNSKSGHLQHHPRFVICRPLHAGQTETIDFDIWHNSPKTNVTDILQVEVQYTRSWRLCNGQKSNKTINLQPMNVTLEPEFEYV